MRRRRLQFASIVHTDDRPGLLAQITSILSNEKANIRSLEARTDIGDRGEGARH